MDTKKQRQCRRDDARLTKSGNARSEQLNTHGAYRVANQQSWACLSGSERRRPGWFLDMKYQTCFSVGYDARFTGMCRSSEAQRPSVNSRYSERLPLNVILRRFTGRDQEKHARMLNALNTWGFFSIQTCHGQITLYLIVPKLVSC